MPATAFHCAIPSPNLCEIVQRSVALDLPAARAGGKATLPPRGGTPWHRPRRRNRNVGFKVAIVGATGNVGREMLNILAERAFPADEVIALASRRSLGTEVSYGDRT